MEDLIARLSRYSEQCIAERLDTDFAEAVVDAKTVIGMVDAMNKPKGVETSIFDQEEIHENCTVQVLANSVTGEVGVGWWENTEAEYVRVVHAKWLVDDKTYSGATTYNYLCSACRKHGGSWLRDLKPEQFPRYCMWCGARMDG